MPRCTARLLLILSFVLLLAGCKVEIYTKPAFSSWDPSDEKRDQLLQVFLCPAYTWTQAY